MDDYHSLKYYYDANDKRKVYSKTESLQTDHSLDKSWATNASSSSFNKQDLSTGRYSNGSQIQLTREQKQRLDSLIEAYPCFSSHSAFINSIDECSRTKTGIQPCDTGAQFWAKMVQRLYSDVFEQLALSR